MGLSHRPAPPQRPRREGSVLQSTVRHVLHPPLAEEAQKRSHRCPRGTAAQGAPTVTAPPGAWALAREEALPARPRDWPPHPMAE